MTGIAVLGCAHIHTPGFIKALKERTDARVLSVWDHDRARAEKNAAELGCPVASSPEVACADADARAVVICSETNRHAELVALAARKRKHLFAEKPLGLGAKDSYAMARTIARSGVLFQTGYFNRCLPAHRFLREQVRLGHFGRITRARNSNCHSGSLKGWFDTDWRWMADPAVAGCGGFGDLGTHALDILLWILGEVDSVTASIQAVTHRYGDCDESGEGLLRFRNGAVATLAAGWVDVADPAKLMISGTEGHAAVINGELYFASSHVPGADGKTPWKDLPPAMPRAFDLFLDAVTGKPDVPLVPVWEAAYCVSVMEALYKGAAQGKWVKPRPLPAVAGRA